MTALALVALLATAASAAGSPRDDARIDVLLMTQLHPSSAEISGPAHVEVAVRGGRLFVEGRPSADVHTLSDATWTLRVPGAAARTFRGGLGISARGRELQLVARMRLEDYVAEAVASETVPGTPPEALKAQAVVSRSYARATAALERPRHEGAHVCDLAHCQVLRGSGAAAHREAARKAALATAGEVLVLEGSGAVALAPFHAACGGHTAEPSELFGGPDPSGAAAVADPGCTAAWTAKLTDSQFERAVRRAFGPGGSAPSSRELRYERGAGGYVTRVVDLAGGRVASGDGFARALDAELRWRGVRSSRFTAVPHGSTVHVTGSGIGHGTGLCQAGAARMARAGLDHGAILARFFPRARLATPITSPAEARP